MPLHESLHTYAEQLGQIARTQLRTGFTVTPVAVNDRDGRLVLEVQDNQVQQPHAVGWSSEDGWVFLDPALDWGPAGLLYGDWSDELQLAMLAETDPETVVAALESEMMNYRQSCTPDPVELALLRANGGETAKRIVEHLLDLHAPNWEGGRYTCTRCTECDEPASWPCPEVQAMRDALGHPQ